MPGFDYSKWDGLGDSSDEEEQKPDAKAAEEEEEERLLSALPSDLSRDLSLILAAKENQQHIAELLLKRKACINAVDPKQMTALHRAVEGGIAYRAIIEHLIKSGADVDSHAPDVGTPISMAARSSPLEMVELLLSCSSASDTSLCGALYEATAGNNMAVVQALLPKVPNSAMHDISGRSALHCAARQGDLAILELLCTRLPAEGVNALDGEGETTLMSAVRGGQPEIVEWLCSQSADVNAHSIEGRSSVVSGRTALMLAAEHPDRDVGTRVGKFLLTRGASADVVAPTQGRNLSSPLVHSVCTEKAGLVDALLERKASVNSADPSGRLALPCAVQTGDPALCKALLGARSDVNAHGQSGRDAEGQGVAALAIAAALGHAPIAELLLEANADPEGTDERKNTPLMIASKMASGAAASEVLLRHRADVNAKHAESGKTPLIIAASSGVTVLCNLLLKHGAEINVKGVSGATALLASAANGHAEVCKALVEAKGSVEDEIQGRKAWDLAESAGQAELAVTLRALAS